jgi:hypothetical protein
MTSNLFNTLYKKEGRELLTSNNFYRELDVYLSLKTRRW